MTRQGEPTTPGEILYFFVTRANEADIEAARWILRRAGGRSPEPEDRLE